MYQKTPPMLFSFSLTIRCWSETKYMRTNKSLILLSRCAPRFSLRNTSHHFSLSTATSPLSPFLLPSLGLKIVVIFLRVGPPGAWSSTSVQDVPRWVSLAMWSGGPKVWQIRDVWSRWKFRIKGAIVNGVWFRGNISHLLTLY